VVVYAYFHAQMSEKLYWPSCTSPVLKQPAVKMNTEGSAEKPSRWWGACAGSEKGTEDERGIFGESGGNGMKLMVESRGAGYEGVMAMWKSS